MSKNDIKIILPDHSKRVHAHQNPERVKLYFVLLLVFVAMGLFSFLTQKFKDNRPVDAANAWNFDPGYIISDWQMGNYGSMTEAQIQAFLTQKNPCNNRNYSEYQYQSSAYSTVKWHWDNGHFICLSEEKFGSGTQIGSGETAAHIIWQAAQDYKINPQVLIVLLEKENGLITDSFPHSGQYKTAAGFGCPDTAPCEEQYFGFRNQVRLAAKLFHEVLTGGWTNYPVGNNYVQYNPSRDCGGTWVNIRNRATSALYRYTPYQPNSAALAAGYGIGDSCSAYGNRNFYLWFEDWFGGSKSEGYSMMDTPRYMTNTETGKTAYYTVKRTVGGETCLSTSASDNNCVRYSKLKDITLKWVAMDTPRYMTGSSSTQRIDLSSSSKPNLNGVTKFYTKKATLPDGKVCLLAENEKGDWCAVLDTIQNTTFTTINIEVSRTMQAKEDVYFIDPLTRKQLQKMKKGEQYYFNKRITLPDGSTCVMTPNKEGCVAREKVGEVWVKLDNEREMVVTSDDFYKKDVKSGTYDYSVVMTKGMVRKFTSKTYDAGEWCLRTEFDENVGATKCVPFSKLGESWNGLSSKEEKTIKSGAQKINAASLELGASIQGDTTRRFTSKYYVRGKNGWCYKTEYDDNLRTNYCFMEKDLK